MAENIAKLVIMVGAKGLGPTNKQFDKLDRTLAKLSGNVGKLGGKMGQAQESTKKFGMGGNKSMLSFVAGVTTAYLTVSKLHKGLKDLETQYISQMSAEIKLQTILSSTGHAVQYTYDEIDALSKAWEKQTGINDKVIKSAAGIAATFTKIEKESFKGVIEQALNMSTIFDQDLKQSVIQLGTALNDPIRGVGRLRRIGISFTQAQKNQIEALIETNDLLGAQTVILDELEVEIGKVARAMGASASGDIKRFANAWENLKEGLGESTSKHFSSTRRAITGLIDDIAGGLDSINNLSHIKDMFNAGSLKSKDRGIAVAALDMDTLTLAAARARKEIETTHQVLYDSAQEAVDDESLFDNEEQEIADRDKYRSALLREKVILATIEELMVEREAHNVQLLADGEALKKQNEELYKSEQQKTWVTNLEGQLAGKKELLVLDAESTQFDKDRAAHAAWFAKIQHTAWFKHRMHEEDLLAIVGEYNTAKLAQIDAEEDAWTALNDKKKAAERIEARDGLVAQYGSEEAQAQLQLSNAIQAVEQAYKDEILTLTEKQSLLDEINKSTEETYSNSEIWDNWRDGIDQTVTQLDILKNVLGEIEEIGIGMATGVFMEGFGALGASLAGSEESAKNFSKSLLDMTASALETAGPMFLSAAAAAAATGNFPVAIAYLGLAAASGMAAGGLGQLAAADSESAEKANAITGSAFSYSDPKDFSGKFNQQSTTFSPVTNIITPPGGKVESTTAPNGDVTHIIVDAVKGTIASGAADGPLQNNFHLKRKGNNL